MAPDAWIIDELEKRERESAELTLSLPKRVEPVHEQKQSQRGVVVLDISPLADNEIKL